jgi:hypothetical protein
LGLENEEKMGGGRCGGGKGKARHKGITNH